MEENNNLHKFYLGFYKKQIVILLFFDFFINLQMILTFFRKMLDFGNDEKVVRFAQSGDEDCAGRQAATLSFAGLWAG